MMVMVMITITTPKLMTGDNYDYEYDDEDANDGDGDISLLCATRYHAAKAVRACVRACAAVPSPTPRSENA